MDASLKITAENVMNHEKKLPLEKQKKHGKTEDQKKAELKRFLTIR